MCWCHIYGESRSLGAEFLTYYDRARPVLPYGTIYFGSCASNPTRPPLRECGDPIFTGRTERVHFYLMVQFFFFRALPTPPSPPLYGNVLIPYLRGDQVPRGRTFYIFLQSASCSTLWYNLLWLARFQPLPATPPGMCWSHIYEESRSLVAEFLTYSDRARPVLPYGTVYFFSCASNPTQPHLRECVDPIFTERSRSAGAEFLTYSDRARPVLPYGTVYFFSRASNPTQPPIRECVDPIFTGRAGPLGPNF